MRGSIAYVQSASSSFVPLFLKLKQFKVFDTVCWFYPSWLSAEGLLKQRGFDWVQNDLLVHLFLKSTT